MKLFDILFSLLRKSYLLRSFSLVFKKAPIFVYSIAYYITLYFVYSNLSYLFVSILYFFVLFFHYKDIGKALFLSFVTCLPFAKGKTYDIILIFRNQIPRIGYYDVGYYFPFTLSFAFLMGIIFWIMRKSVSTKTSNFPSVAISYIFFISICLVPIFTSQFPLVIGLSVVQLVLMLFIFLLPYWLRLTKDSLHDLSHVLSAFVIFEFLWILGQVIYSGPLGNYIESILTLDRVGILSYEDPGLMRFNGTFYEPSIMGTFMVMHLTYFSFLLRKTPKIQSVDRILYSLGIISAFISIVFSGSRGIYGIVVLFFLLFYRFYVYKYVKSFFVSRRNFNLLWIFVIAIYIFSPYVSKRLETLPTLFGKEGSGTFRVKLNSYAYRLATINSFGVGLNLSPYYLATGFPEERNIDPSHPHNLVFQILAETGFPGLMAFLLFIWLLYRGYFRLRKSQSDPYLYASICFLLAAQFYPIFISQQEIVSFFFLHAGLLTWTQDLTYET